MARKLWRAGDKSEVICPSCRHRTTTTFVARKVPLVGRRTRLLVALCDECGNVATIPAQSTPRVKAALKR
jgi:ribosomal protein S27E